MRYQKDPHVWRSPPRHTESSGKGRQTPNRLGLRVHDTDPFSLSSARSMSRARTRVRRGKSNELASLLPIGLKLADVERVHSAVEAFAIKRDHQYPDEGSQDCHSQSQPNDCSFLFQIVGHV